MNPSTVLLYIAACGSGFAMCWALTAMVRHYAISSQMIDEPNTRSSHVVPTPRGGGVAIVASFLILLSLLAANGGVQSSLLGAIVWAGLTVAVLGFIDDRISLPARLRFLGHLAAAGWSLWCLKYVPPVPILGFSIELGVFGTVVAGLFIAWMINLFNFMDGIDGIASIEAITVSLGGALAWWLTGTGTDWMVAPIFAACVAGFLAWNFPSARIFMGDTGSGFLGLVLAVLSLWAGQNSPPLFWSWFILIGCFMVDTCTTLVRRVLRGEKFYEAHRCHAYQYASRVHGSHRTVSLAVGVINIFWLLPFALAVALQWIDGVAATLLAYAPLVWLAFRYKAGDRAAQSA